MCYLQPDKQANWFEVSRGGLNLDLAAGEHTTRCRGTHQVPRYPCKYQANGNAAELDNVGVGDGIESADPGVKNGDEGGYDDGWVKRDLEDDSKRCA